MMVFCNLLISYEQEECYVPATTPDKEPKKEEASYKLLNEAEDEDSCVLPDLLLKYTDYLVNFLLFSLFSVFNLMIVMTSLYYHTPIEKVLGVAMGVAAYAVVTFHKPAKDNAVK